MGIATEGLIKTEDEMMQEQQQQTQAAQQQGLMEKLGPEVIRQGGALLQNQQNQQGGEPAV